MTRYNDLTHWARESFNQTLSNNFQANLVKVKVKVFFIQVVSDLSYIKIKHQFVVKHQHTIKHQYTIRYTYFSVFI